MKTKKYKDEIKEVCLLEELAKEIVNKVNTDESTFETLQQDNVSLFSFVETFLSIVPTLKDKFIECQKIKDSETFRNKIIDREIEALTNYQEMLEVGKITNRPTDLQILMIQIKGTFEITAKVLEKLKDTYSKDEDTLRIEM